MSRNTLAIILLTQFCLDLFSMNMAGGGISPPLYTHKHKLKEIKEHFSGNNDLCDIISDHTEVTIIIFPIFDFTKKNKKLDLRPPDHRPKKFQTKFVTIVMKCLPKNVKLVSQNAGYGVHEVKDTLLISQVL